MYKVYKIVVWDGETQVAAVNGSWFSDNIITFNPETALDGVVTTTGNLSFAYLYIELGEQEFAAPTTRRIDYVNTARQ